MFCCDAAFWLLIRSALILRFASSAAQKGRLESNVAETSTEVAFLGQDSCDGCTEALSQAYQTCVMKHGNPCAKTNSTGSGKKDLGCCMKKEKHAHCLKCSSLDCTHKTCDVNQKYYNLRAITEKVEEERARPQLVAEKAVTKADVDTKPAMDSGGTSKPHLLSLMSVNLESWGSKAATRTAELPLDKMLKQAANHAVELVMNPLAQVLPSESNLFDPRGFQSHSTNFFLEPQSGNAVRNFAILTFIVLLLALVLSCLCCDGASSDEDTPPHSPDKEVQDFATVEFSDGSWAQVYREARGEQKEALELLFRCNIISTDEFAFSSVSQEHIQECIWIATHMLRQKPLEEWVALWQQAQQTFEDSVTACFEARGGPHSPLNFQNTPAMMVPALSLGAVPLAGRSNRLSPSIGEDEDEDDPYTTRTRYSPQDPMRIPDSQNSQNTMDSDQSRWSIESELDRGLTAHGLQ